VSMFEPEPTARPERPVRHDVCAVCGAEARTEAVEDTNGWRWFSDGRGGLVPLCSSCPVPTEHLESLPPNTTDPLSRTGEGVATEPRIGSYVTRR